MTGDNPELQSLLIGEPMFAIIPIAVIGFRVVKRSDMGIRVADIYAAGIDMPLADIAQIGVVSTHRINTGAVALSINQHKFI